MENDSPLERRVSQLLQKTALNSKDWDISHLLKEGECQSVAFLNAHAINQAIREVGFYQFLLKSDFLLRDGIGVKLALQLFDLPLTENLNGTDLIPKILSYFKGKKIALFGASMEALEGAKNRLANAGIDHVVAMEHGFHDFDVYLKSCEMVRPDIVVLCMGMPKQELLAARLVEQKLAGLVICGGGWADFYSGTKKRAPEWVRKLSLEWVHRLLSEPKRLGKRYTVDVIYYFYVIIRSKLAGSKV